MLPDAWELTYFPSLATQGGDADFDADGLTNYEEFLYDTLPNNRLSRLDFEVITAGDNYAVQWFSSSRRSYRLQSSFTLESDSWTNTQNGQRAGTDALMSETFSVAGSPKRSFRLIVESP